MAVIMAEAGAWWWMHPVPTGTAVKVLSYKFPLYRVGYSARPLKPEIAKTLACDSSQLGTVRDAGCNLEVSYFEWDGTDDTGLMQAFSHTPEVCMGASGFKVQGHLPNRRYEVDGQELLFDVTLFADAYGDPIFIFKAPWAEGTWGIDLLRQGPSAENAESIKTFRQFKFQAVLHRWKPHFARVVMGSATGFFREEDAWEFFRANVLTDLELTDKVIEQR